MIALRLSPNTTGVSGEEFLGATALSLIKEYSDFLIEWPYLFLLNGRQGVEANYEAGLPFQGGRVSVIGWKAVFLEGDQQWLIQVVGRSEYREELEGIHDRFLAGFHLVTVQGQD